MRGINVGGHNLVKMEDLRQLFLSLGFNNVKSYINSGNIIFETSEIDSNAIIKGIHRELNELLEGDVKVFLRDMPQVEEITQLNPFKDIESQTTKLYVTFLSEEPSRKIRLPLNSPDMNVEVIFMKNRENNFKITHPTIIIMVMRDHEPKVFTDLRSIILPAKFQYLTTALSSTIYSSWGGDAVAGYWLHINGSLTLQVHVGMMKIITSNAANGHAVIAARASSLLFAIVATIFGIILTKNLMDLANKSSVVEQ